MTIKVKRGNEVETIPDCLCITVLQHKCPEHGASPTWLVVALRKQLERAKP